MKRIFSILLITVMLVGLMPVIPNVAMAASYATITSENGLGVNLREGPGTGYKKIDSYPVGTAVEVLQQGSEWSQIQLGGSVTGWMMSRFLIFGAGGSGSTGSTGSTNAYVVSDNGLRVWLRASAGGTRLFLNAAGTPVEVISYDSEWCYIRIGATYGYMKTKYLSVGQQSGGEGDGTITAPVVTSGRVTEVEINYTHPVVLDTLEAIVTSPDAQVDYEWYVSYPDGMGGYKAGTLLGKEATFEVLTRYADCKIQVKVTGKDGSTGTAWSDWTAPVQISKGLKSVEIDKDGAPVVGETLSALLVPSSALGDYSWRVGGVEVSTESTYTVQESDLGKMIQLRVTGIAGYVGTVACSADAAVVSDKTLISAELNKVNPVLGDTLSVVVEPAGATYTYSWLSGGEEVGTSASYIVKAPDLGRQITVNVTGVDPYTGTVSATTAKVSSGKLNSVSITGAPLMYETVYAKLNPEKATATYQWFIGDIPVQQGVVSSLLLDPVALGVAEEDMIGEKIMVRAYPSGVYNVDNEEGFVEYTLSEEIYADYPIDAIVLSETTPVVEDTIEAILLPEKAEDVKDQFSYVWYIGYETVSGTGAEPYKYTVKESDAGKCIRVQVIGKDLGAAGDYSGETAYSTWSSPVITTKNLAGVTVTNLNTDLSALHNYSVVGDVLEATVVPAAADPFVKYTWKDAFGNIRHIGKTFPTSPAIDLNKSYVIEVTVDPALVKQTDVINKTENYTGSVAAVVAPILASNHLDADFYIRKPEPGITPMFGTSCKDANGITIATAGIEWLQWDPTGTVMEKASFDKYGNFETGVSYVAKLNVTPLNGKSLYQASVKVNGAAATPDPDGGYNTNIFYYTFPAIAFTDVTDFYIADLEKPYFSAGNWVTDPDCGNDQVESTSVVWTYNAADSTYVAEIGLVGVIPAYSFSKVPENAFKVNGADSTTNAAGSNVVYATYKVDHAFYIDTDKSEVYLDGYNRVIVQCSAYMTNHAENITGIKWEIVSPKVDGTSIDANGQLIVGMYETPDRVLTIRATVTIAGEEYVAEKDIQLISGTNTDTAISITFKKYATQIKLGDTALYSAIVSNSTHGCNIFAIDKDGNNALLGANSGTLFSAGLNPGDKIVIKAISNEDHSVTASLLVEILDPLLGIDTNQVYNAEGEEDELVAEEAPLLDADLTDDELVLLIADSMEDELVAETVEEAVVEITEEVVEESVIEITEEVIEEPVIEIVEEVVEEPVIEIVEEVVEEPVIEITEEVVEEPVIEITEEVVEEPVIEITEEVVEEPAAEVTEEVVEEEVIDASMILIKDTVSGEEIEIIEETAEETVEEIVEEPAEEEVEVLDDVTIAIKDTVTGEVVEEDIPVNSEKPAAEEKTEAKAEKADEEKAEELAEEIPDEELDALEGEDIGKSLENEAQIVISFTKTVSEAKRGTTAEFAAEIEGSDAGVQWILRRSKNADGKVVSTISQDGVLTVSADETADKLVVIAAAAEDTTIRARWIVDVPQKSASAGSSRTEEVIELTEDVVEEIIPVEQPEDVIEETVEEPVIEEEIVAEDEGLSDDILKRIEEELKMLEEQQSVLNFF